MFTRTLILLTFVYIAFVKGNLERKTVMIRTSLICRKYAEEQKSSSESTMQWCGCI